MPLMIQVLATIMATTITATVSWFLSARTAKKSMQEGYELDKKRDLLKITLPLEIEAYAEADAAHAAYIVDCIEVVDSTDFDGFDEYDEGTKNLAASGEKASVTRGNPFILLNEKCFDELEKIDVHCSNAFTQRMNCFNNQPSGSWNSEINSARKALTSYREQVAEIFRKKIAPISTDDISKNAPEGETSEERGNKVR